MPMPCRAATAPHRGSILRARRCTGSRPRLTFSRIFSAVAVHTNGLGSLLLVWGHDLGKDGAGRRDPWWRGTSSLPKMAFLRISPKRTLFVVVAAVACPAVAHL